MDFVGYLILIAICIIIFHFAMFVVAIYQGIYQKITSNSDGTFCSKETKTIIKGILDLIKEMTINPLIIIIVFFILMYIIYLIIIYVIPPTGFATLFIPIREILLKIPPLPSLIDRGVFRLFDKILGLFGLKAPFIKIIVKFNNALYEFSRENIKDALILLFPSLRNEIEEQAKKQEEKFYNDNKKPELQNMNDSEIYRQIEQDKQACIAQNIIMITPDMTSSQKMDATIKNNFEKVNCESKSIGNYIRSNN